jgi:hypothetical protein
MAAPDGWCLEGGEELLGSGSLVLWEGIRSERELHAGKGAPGHAFGLCDTYLLR